MLAFFGLTSCSQGGQSGDEIAALTQTIQGKSPDEVRDVIVQQFGPPERNVGFGLRIEQWDVARGVLTFHPLQGPSFAKGGVHTRLMRTNNTADDCLFGSYEMKTLPDPANYGTRFWLGNVTLPSDGRYHYEDSGQNLARRTAQSKNFFMLYPEGKAVVEYAAGITGRTRLEDVSDGRRIATVTFSANDGPATQAYDIITSRTSMDLTVESTESIPFQMEKGWVNYWR